MTAPRLNPAPRPLGPAEVEAGLVAAAGRTGLAPARLLAEAAEARGPLARAITPVGEGARALAEARPGDILIARDLFDRTDPHYQIVGLGGPEAAESWAGEDAVLLRPAENVAALAPILGPAIGQALGQAVTDPTAPVRGAIQTASQGLDLGLRVARIASQVRNSFRGLNFSGAGLSMRSSYTPANAPQLSTTWRFELHCRYDRGDPDRAVFPFQVAFSHDCFSIHDAQIVPLSPTIGYLTHEMTVQVEPVPTPYSTTLPPSARFRMTGLWDPADVLGRVQERFAGWVIVSADGRVQVQGMTGDLVSRGPARLVEGGGGVCPVLYGRMGGPAEPAFPGGGAPARPQGGGGGGARRPSRSPDLPAPPDPPNGKHVFFAPNRTTPTPDIQAQVHAWWGGLRPELQMAIRLGRIGVTIAGHADPTGPESGNRALSHQRAVQVEGLVRALVGGNPQINSRGWGSQQAREAGVPAGRSDTRWRRVTIELDRAGPIL